MSKDDDSCTVTFLIFLPPSPSSVLHTSLRSARANTHVLILVDLSRSLAGAMYLNGMYY